jgi:hypothetical protein
MESDEQKKQFLLDVVNARDRGNPIERETFAEKYRDWFPKYDTAQLAKHEVHYEKVRKDWCVQTRLPIEPPNTEFGLKVAILRHQLRVLWIEQSETYRKQDLTLSHIATTIAGMERQPKEKWRTLQIDALRWLERHLAQLVACENPECDTSGRYFFRSHPNDRYCCTRCREIAKETRREKDRAAKPSKQYTRTEEARDNMSKAASRRWARYRGEHNPDEQSK